MTSNEEGQPMGVFENCVVIVTGASEGIGRALCVARGETCSPVLAARNGC
jgi:NAD(P)-dependent dehydrogenase (short-subunit alcohol dehydrogenase family)